MEKASTIEEFVKGIAERLCAGFKVRYNLKTLEYGEIHQSQIEEYGAYVDMDELPEDKEFRDWEIDLVQELRNFIDLPDELERPYTSTQIEWMVDFANEQSKGHRFVKEVQRAIDSRHPFIEFKYAMARYDLLQDWYSFRNECYQDYVRRELGV